LILPVSYIAKAADGRLALLLSLIIELLELAIEAAIVVFL